MNHLTPYQSAKIGIGDERHNIFRVADKKIQHFVLCLLHRKFHNNCPYVKPLSFCVEDTMKRKLEKRISKLESKFEELLDYLKLEAVSEEETLLGNETYFKTLITKKRKNDW